MVPLDLPPISIEDSEDNMVRCKIRTFQEFRQRLGLQVLEFGAARVQPATHPLGVVGTIKGKLHLQAAARRFRKYLMLQGLGDPGLRPDKARVAVTAHAWRDRPPPTELDLLEWVCSEHITKPASISTAWQSRKRVS